MTSCSFKSDKTPCKNNYVMGPQSYVTVTLWAWQIKAPGNYAVCNAAHDTQKVAIDDQTHHLTVPQSLRLNLTSSCDSTVVIKTEVSVSNLPMYVSSSSTSVGGYHA
jgi:hypothetical protein